tara:strand:- start:1140 stop:2294 length:1155 start_codon:yes stop_codon:yes gene_type:complete
MKSLLKFFLLISFCFFSIFPSSISAEENLKIGLLIPMTGKNQKLGDLIIKAVRLAVNDIDNGKIEIIPKDTASNPETTLKSANDLKEKGIKIIIGPIFFNSLRDLGKVEDVIFLSLTNKTINLPKNVISSGINSTSQINTIKKFTTLNSINKSLFLIPKIDYEKEIKKSLKLSKFKSSKIFSYDTEPTELTKQIENVTNYKIRKQNLTDEINRLEKSDDPNKEKKIKNLEKRYTIGNVKYDSFIIADFDESLKSVATSLLYTDISPKKKYFVTLNQWFDESIIREESLQPIYYPSIDKENFDKFRERFLSKYNFLPNHLSILSYDLIGLVYYLSTSNDFSNLNNLFKKESIFKGKIGIFDIRNNEINHRLNFYKVEEKKIIKIF